MIVAAALVGGSILAGVATVAAAGPNDGGGRVPAPAATPMMTPTPKATAPMRTPTPMPRATNMANQNMNMPGMPMTGVPPGA